MNSDNDRREGEYDLPDDYIPQIRRQVKPAHQPVNKTETYNSEQSYMKPQAQGTQHAAQTRRPRTEGAQVPQMHKSPVSQESVAAPHTAANPDTSMHRPAPQNGIPIHPQVPRQESVPAKRMSTLTSTPVRPDLSAFQSAAQEHMASVPQSPARRSAPQNGTVPQVRRPAVRQTAEGEHEPEGGAVRRAMPQNAGVKQTLSQPARPHNSTISQNLQSQSVEGQPIRRAIAERRNPAASQNPLHPGIHRNAQDTDGKTRIIDRKKVLEAQEDEADETGDETVEESNAVFSLIKAIIYIVIVIAVSGLISYYAIVFGNDMYAFVKSDEEVEVTIPEYATVEEIADVLGESGVVKYPNLLILYAKLKKIDKNYVFVAGTYTVNGMMNYDELFYAFVKSKSYETVRITIPEGYTVDEIITLFNDNGIGTREGFIKAINEGEYDFDFVRALDALDLKGRTYRLEGYLYPDTYDFYKSSSEETVINKLLTRFNTIFTSDFYDIANNMGYSIDQIMTIASMIEKEARYAGDYETVSSVFHNRLNDPGNYPYLESDATIMYAIQVRDGARKGKLTSADMSYDSPYNTYLYKGLPPGPIANPGYEAITCALYPAKTSYHYFVSDSFGNTYFSKTLTQHTAAVAKVRETEG